MPTARLFLSLFCLLSTAVAQVDVWQQVKTQPDSRPERVSVSKAQFSAVKNLIARSGAGAWPCSATGDDWAQALIFEDLPVSSTDKVFLIEAGPGCARGGQGANGAMWAVRFAGGKPSLLAAPKQGFNGWLYAVQESVSHGLRDVVLGWHMSAASTSLSYFRFNGTLYKQIGTAELTSDAEGNPKIVPERK